MVKYPGCHSSGECRCGALGCTLGSAPALCGFRWCFSGLFAISEAAAVTALYVVLAEVFGYREINLRQAGQGGERVHGNGRRYFADLGVALGFTNFLVDAEVPQQLMALMQEHIQSPLVSCCC